MIPSRNCLEKIAFNATHHLNWWAGVRGNGELAFLDPNAAALLGVNWSYVGVNVIVIEFCDSNGVISRYTTPHNPAYEEFIQDNSSRILTYLCDMLSLHRLPPDQSGEII